MEGNRMTITEVLDITVKNLKSVSLPVELMETAGQVILGSVRNIEACLEAMKNAGNADGGDDNGADNLSE